MVDLLREHESFMKEALKQAWKAYAKADCPIGAIVVKDGVIIGRGYNNREAKQNPLGHAELEAIKSASKKIGSWRLIDCDLYVTLEPCPMCAGAIIQSRVRKVYVGAMDPKAGAVRSVISLFDVDKFNHKVEYEVGILDVECSSILKKFFKELRNGKFDK